MDSIDPLRALIQQSPILASIAAVFLLLCSGLLVAFWRLRHRLVAMQTQLDCHSSDIRKLEIAHEGLLIRFINLPRSRKSSGRSTVTLEEKKGAHTQSEDKNFQGSALYLVSPKTSPE